jgi:hypothetical protein
MVEFGACVCQAPFSVHVILGIIPSPAFYRRREKLSNMLKISQLVNVEAII